MRVNRLSRQVLKNKIDRELVIVGTNSVLESFDYILPSIEYIILPEKYEAQKIQEVEKLAKQSKVAIFYDSNLVKFVKAELEIGNPGVICVLKKKINKYYSLTSIKKYIEDLNTCTVVAVSDIDYERNLGAIIRTCLALNVDFLLVSNRQQKAFSLTVTKVSMGYNFVLPIVQENFLLAIDELSKLGFDILGLDMGGENIQTLSYNPKVCFVIGNEGEGLTDTVVSKCDKTISIPMNNVVESLNVSTSLGIVLYDRISKLEI